MDETQIATQKILNVFELQICRPIASTSKLLPYFNAICCVISEGCIFKLLLILPNFEYNPVDIETLLDHEYSVVTDMRWMIYWYFLLCCFDLWIFILSPNVGVIDSWGMSLVNPWWIWQPRIFWDHVIYELSKKLASHMTHLMRSFDVVILSTLEIYLMRLFRVIFFFIKQIRTYCHMKTNRPRLTESCCELFGKYG
jgi:hypothetical protein